MEKSDALLKNQQIWRGLYDLRVRSIRIEVLGRISLEVTRRMMRHDHPRRTV